MPLLEADDALPHRPSRVLVSGTSGSGKSTLARQIGRLLDLPYAELDSLFHGPGWTPLPDFVEKVDAFTSGPCWACEFQYDAVRPMLLDRADLMVWLDHRHRVVMRRVATRTVVRRLRREHLWNGNQEPPLRTILTDPEHIIRYAWGVRHGTAERAQAMLESHPGLIVVRLRSPQETRRWLAGPLAQACGATPWEGRSGEEPQEGRR